MKLFSGKYLNKMWYENKSWKFVLFLHKPAIHEAIYSQSDYLIEFILW